MMTSLGHPELTVTVETMGSHVVRDPPRDLNTHTHTHIRGTCVVWNRARKGVLEKSVCCVCGVCVCVVCVCVCEREKKQREEPEADYAG